ncbi:Rabankyrin-5 [Nymphon striatum]|nr:Rabankyrin-5 [Nymphon striatum]
MRDICLLIYCKSITVHCYYSIDPSKLQHHLALLRQEYTKLQNEYFTLKKRYDDATAGTDKAETDSFISKLLKIIAGIFDKETFSDLKVKLDGTSIYAHKFVLAAHTDLWSISKLADTTELDLSHLSKDISLGLLKWIYTDEVDLSAGEVFVLEMMKVAKEYQLHPLFRKCEQNLIMVVNVRNCIRFYQTADEVDAMKLHQHCSELIAMYWTEYPLHSAVKLHREDVVFLYLIECTAELPFKLNEQDSEGNLPLDLALKDKQDSIAKSLLNHGVNVNATDNRGRSLLHKSIERFDKYSSLFLIENGASVNCCTPIDNESPLHILAKIPEKDIASSHLQDVASALIEKHADPNLQDRLQNNVLHQTVKCQNQSLFDMLMKCDNLKLELKNDDGHTALWSSLLSEKKYNEGCMSAKLISKGSSADAINSSTGDSLLHLAATDGLEDAGIFLINNKAKVDHINDLGESPLHIACKNGLTNLTMALLKYGANPNSLTAPFILPSNFSNLFSGDESETYQFTALQLAILSKHDSTISAFISHKENAPPGKILPNFNVKNSHNQTALSLTLLMGLYEIAVKLIDNGAKMDIVNSDGMTLLHEAIWNQNSKSALFLLGHNADTSVKTKDGETALQLAIKRHLPVVVEALCGLGVDMRGTSDVGQCPLWIALDSGQEDIASILVQHGVDTDCWGEGPSHCYQTLLHRAIDENNEAVACFLIRSGCDINAIRCSSPEGLGEEEAHDKMTPLHLSSTWGLENVVQTLIEHNADVNMQDHEGKSPLHVAIENQHPVIISLLLAHPDLNLNVRNKQGMSPFSIAMTMKNNRAAQGILDREADAAEQVDNRGRNFLHVAVQNNDIESVLFLISIKVNIHSRIQDSSQNTPLHLAVQKGSEIIVRNLLLAEANVNDRTPQKQTSLHIAAELDHSSICSIIIENGVDFDAVDTNLNNALHVAAQKGNLASCRALLSESNIQAEAINLRGQNPLHVLCQYGKENAAAIFELFMQCLNNFPINKQDVEGNTPLLLSYMNGNGSLCRAIVREGACLGTMNKNGVNIFNYQVATKQLLFKLLGEYCHLPLILYSLSKEPSWSEGEVCLECSNKFGLTNRKHHCRHCGRILCAKCSGKDMPILKYNIMKPVRVCEVCFDVLSLGSGP